MCLLYTPAYILPSSKGFVIIFFIFLLAYEYLHSIAVTTTLRVLIYFNYNIINSIKLYNTFCYILSKSSLKQLHYLNEVCECRRVGRCSLVK